MSQVTRRIAANTDDGYKDSAWRDYFTIATGRSDPNNIITGLRWNNITIPNTATITSAYLTLFFSGGGTNGGSVRVRGIAEDDTATFSSDPTGRSTTTAYTDTTVPEGMSLDTTWTSADIKSPIQEVISRAGWSSGNDLGIFIYNVSCVYDHTWDGYNNHPDTAAYIEINYTNPSASLSPSSSKSISVSATPSISPSLSGSHSYSLSVSASPSITGSVSVSATPSLSTSLSASLTPSSSISASPSITPMIPFFGLRVSKPGINVLTGDDPRDFIFNSDYGTLKYLSKQAINLSFDANADYIATSGSYTHNLGYYPFTEVYVKVWIDDASLYNYQYCPFFNSGATVEYNATYTISTTAITVYGEIIGMSTSVWHFDFLVFVFKNDLQL